MAFITMASFVLRMWLTYTEGWASWVDSWLELTSSGWRVALAVTIPPMVDAIQSTMLIMTGRNAKPLLLVVLDEQKAIKKTVREIHEMVARQGEQIDDIQNNQRLILNKMDIVPAVDP